MLQSLHCACSGTAQTVLEHGGSFAGVNRKVQLKPLRWAPPEPGSTGQPPRIVEALLILKHGGVLTHAGRQQVGRPSAFTLQSAGRAGAPCEGCWPWAAAVSGCVPLLFRQCSGHLLPHHVVSVSARHACSCSAGVFLGV